MKFSTKYLIFLLLSICVHAFSITEIPIFRGETREHKEKVLKAEPYDLEGPNLIGFLDINKEKPIDRSTYIYTKFALKKFEKEKVKMIVIRLDTPGGDVIPALKIADALIDFQVKSSVPVMAFIHDWALSAGALIAYSCEFITINPKSVLGAAQPVLRGQGGEVQSSSEKVTTALTDDIVNLSLFFGRNPLLAKAMVNPNLLLVRRGDFIAELDNATQIKSSDIVLNKPGKLLTLHAKGLWDLGIADFRIPPFAMKPVSIAQRSEAKWPVSKSPIGTLPFFKDIPGATFITYENWMLPILAFLTNPIVSALLLLGFILCVYVQTSKPSSWAIGALGLLFFICIFFAGVAVYTVGWLEISLLVLGAGLLLIEFFVIPGFTVTGVLGIFFLLIGFITLLLPLRAMDLVDFKVSPLLLIETLLRIYALLSSILVSFITMMILSRCFPSRFLPLKSFIQRNVPARKENLPQPGVSGIALTDLSPEGKIEVAGHTFDAVADSPLSKGDPIKIDRLEGDKIFVIKY